MYQESNEEIARRALSFTYQTPLPTQPPRYERLRKMAGDLAQIINQSCPPSRERSLAMTKLEEAVMWANKAIACNES